MTVPDSQVFSGHGEPMRIPVHVVPGKRHRIEWEVLDDLGDAVDVTSITITITMHDALTGQEIFEYVPATTSDLGDPLEDNELAWEATPELTGLLDYLAEYETRWVRTAPGPDLLAAGPVIFPAHAVPATEAAA